MKRVLVTTLIGLSFVGYAQNSNETLQQATVLLDRGQPDQAYQLLQQSYEADKAGNQELFLLGMSAKGTGDKAAAKGYFEQLLARDPNAARVKLELAETVYQQGDKQYARNLLLDVKKMNPPQGVLQNINGFIAQIDNPNIQSSRRGVSWNFWGEAGFMVDSNANAAPAIDTVTMYKIPFDLSDDAKETNDTAKIVKLGVSNAIPIGKQASWQTHLSMQWQDYTDLSNLDSLQLSLQTGPNVVLSNQTSLSLPVTANRVKFGHGEPYYYYGYGISPRLTYRVSPQLSLNLAGTVANRNYRSDSKPNVKTLTLTPSVQYAVSAQGVLGGGLTLGRESSDNDFDSNRSLGVYGNYRHQFDDSLMASISLGYEGQNYDDNEPAFSDKRKDKLFNVGVSVSKHVAPIDADISLSVSHTNNDSNLPLYDYKRTQTYLSINKQF